MQVEGAYTPDHKPKAKIFISYSRADTLVYAEALGNELTGQRFACFLDQWAAPQERTLPRRVVRAALVQRELDRGRLDPTFVRFLRQSKPARRPQASRVEPSPNVASLAHDRV